jgi:hypothetical protein
MAEMNDELEICHSLENVNCTSDTPNEPIEPKTTNEILPSIEPKTTTEEPIISTESSTLMD